MLRRKTKAIMLVLLVFLVCSPIAKTLADPVVYVWDFHSVVGFSDDVETIYWTNNDTTTDYYIGGWSSENPEDNAADSPTGANQTNEVMIYVWDYHSAFAITEGDKYIFTGSSITTTDDTDFDVQTWNSTEPDEADGSPTGANQTNEVIIYVWGYEWFFGITESDQYIYTGSTIETTDDNSVEMFAWNATSPTDTAGASPTGANQTQDAFLYLWGCEWHWGLYKSDSTTYFRYGSTTETTVEDLVPKWLTDPEAYYTNIMVLASSVSPTNGSLHQTNSTLYMNVTAQDIAYGLDQAWLATNETGSWLNYTDGTYGSPISYSGSLASQDISFEWTGAVNTTLGYEIFINNTAGEIWSTGQNYVEMWDGMFVGTTDSSTINNTATDSIVYIPVSSSSGIGGYDLTPIFDTIGNNTDYLQVADSEGLPMYFEVQEWNSTTEQGKLWSQMTSELSNTTDSKVRLFYDLDRNSTLSGYNNVTTTWSGYYIVSHLEDNPDTSHVADVTSYGNDGTKTGAATPAETTSGRVGNAQNFTATSYVVNFGDLAVDHSTGYVIGFSFLIDDLSTTSSLLSKGYYGQDFVIRYITSDASSGYIESYISDGSGSTVLNTGASSITDNEWHDIIFVHHNTGDMGYLYLDGVLMHNASDLESGIDANGYGIYLGHDSNTGNAPVNGCIDEFFWTHSTTALAIDHAAYAELRTLSLDDNLFDWGTTLYGTGVPENDTLPEIAFSWLSDYNVIPNEHVILRVTASDAEGLSEISSVQVELTDGIILKYDNTTDTFSEVQDTSSLCTPLTALSQATVVNSTAINVDFRFYLSSSTPVGTKYLVEDNTKVTDIYAQTANTSATLFLFSTTTNTNPSGGGDDDYWDWDDTADGDDVDGLDGVDRDGDGEPDAWDTDGDGELDTWDDNGDGDPDSWDTDGDGDPDAWDTDADGDEDAFDTDGDGVADMWDTDGDGTPDSYVSPASLTDDGDWTTDPIVIPVDIVTNEYFILGMLLFVVVLVIGVIYNMAKKPSTADNYKKRTSNNGSKRTSITNSKKGRK